MKGNSFFQKLKCLLLFAGLMLLTNCKRDTANIESKDDMIKRMVTTLSTNTHFTELVSQQDELVWLAVTTARAGSFFISADPTSHKFLNEISRVNEKDTAEIIRLYLTQFTAGDKIVEIIYRMNYLKEHMKIDIPELDALGGIELETILERSFTIVRDAIKLTAISISECRKKYREDLADCSTRATIGGAICGITVGFPPVFAACLAGLGGAIGACVVIAILDYKKCDPEAPSAPPGM